MQKNAYLKPIQADMRHEFDWVITQIRMLLQHLIPQYSINHN